MSVPRQVLVTAEEAAWLRLHEFTGRVIDGEWERPGCTGDWSAKDVLAHVACWCAEAVRQLECIRAGQPSKSPEVESFNAASYEACRDLTVHEILSMAAAAHHRLQEELQAVALVALGPRTVEMIHECSDRHYLEHLKQLEEFLRART